MQIQRCIEVPTGHILVVDGELGNLELVSIGDYGKDVNISSLFLGLDREIGQVKHQELLPLNEKWVITVSTQYGCSMGCKFCDVPLVGRGVNATTNDLIDQVKAGMSLHPEVDWSDRLNIHFARMGEPTFNRAVIECCIWAHDWLCPTYMVHPVVSTMMPKRNDDLLSYLIDWCDIKNDLYDGNAGLQLSINSTNDIERDKMFSGSSMSLDEVSSYCDCLPMPVGRKYTLNFAVAGYEIDAGRLLDRFDPDMFIVKLTPMHKTKRASDSGIATDGDYTTIYPYKRYKEALEAAGYDVIVFIASKEEDESMITCGNAVLSGRDPLTSAKSVLE
jgi:23S rRNA (adenine2503-C2)-methyltransferase